MTRLYWLFGVVFLLGIGFLIPSSANSLTLLPEAFAFSSVIRQTDVVVVGTAGTVSRDGSIYRIPFHVERAIRGTGVGHILSIEVLPGAFPSGPSSLSTGTRWLLFLKSDNGAFRMPLGSVGMFRPEMEGDVRMVLSAFERNPDLFSRTSPQALIDLFYAVAHTENRNRILFDLADALTENDINFISDRFHSGEEKSQRFAVRQIGRLGLHAFRIQVENLLKSGSNISVKADAMNALADLASPESLSIVLEYLQGEELKGSAILAAGQIGTNEIIEPLKALYLREKDHYVRNGILNAMRKAPDKALVTETEAYLLSISVD